MQSSTRRGRARQSVRGAAGEFRKYGVQRIGRPTHSAHSTKAALNLTFLGTRGEIDARTRRHRMHTSLLVSYRNARVMIDCGLDWLGKLERLGPSAIVLTHSHPDHAWGLRNGAPCPVHAPEKTWQSLQHFAVKDRRVINERTP